jgi:hypothetical protein
VGRRTRGINEGHLGSKISVRGLLTALADRGIPASRVEMWLDHFLRVGWLRSLYRLQGSRRQLVTVEILDPDAIQEFAYPGERVRRRDAVDQARAIVSLLSHPIAKEIERLLNEPGASHLSPALVNALGAVARHVENGDVLAARVFSARYLGDSKALEPLRGRLEEFLGPLETLGIREGAALVLIGGRGRILLGAQELDFATFTPFLGLTRETLGSRVRLEFPSEGLFVVENLAPFEASCRDEVEAAKGKLVLWAAGYPSRAVRFVVEQAAAQRVPVQAWCDLDLDGVRIARLIASWAPSSFQPYRMAPDDVAAAPRKQLLSPRLNAAIQAELRAKPEDLFADTLRALLACNSWVEQEVFLGR